MTRTASVPTMRDGIAGGERIPLDSAADVAVLVELLGQPYADTASIQTEHAAMDAHVAHGFGYLLYSGQDGYILSDGDPTSPAVASETGFPAGTGLPLADFTAALEEFVRTERAPSGVQWRPASDADTHR
jgi:hypothetical protein